MTVAGLVLAAGGGSRFHSPTHKLLTHYRGKPIVQWAIEHATASGFDAVAVVMGAVDVSSYCPTDVVTLHNPLWETGLASSLRVGIAWCESQGHDVVVVGLGDSPAIPTTAWQSVANANVPIAVANFDGLTRPPVRIEQQLWSALPSMGDAGARALWHGDDVLEVPCEGNPADIDTLDDLALLTEDETVSW